MTSFCLMIFLHICPEVMHPKSIIHTFPPLNISETCGNHDLKPMKNAARTWFVSVSKQPRVFFGFQNHVCHVVFFRHLPRHSQTILFFLSKFLFMNILNF